MIDVQVLIWFAEHLKVYELGGHDSWLTCRAELHPLGLRIRIRRKNLGLMGGRILAADRILDLEELASSKNQRAVMERAFATAMAQIDAEEHAQRECSV